MSVSCCGEETGEEGKPKQRRQLPYAAKNGGRISRRERVATQSRINECEGGVAVHIFKQQLRKTGGGGKRLAAGGGSKGWLKARFWGASVSIIPRPCKILLKLASGKALVNLSAS
ncbi:unnamed protein product [Lactuca virosa]|uniref:Uncharacterized protein n=1 Tax=Lactuca virosa TaxID=75947 RepID=A0AAU9NGH2_9ASTR|nr:unnamed protein product [Lactuca virosa]